MKTQDIEKRAHELNCANRENTTVSGVTDVDSFNENEIIASTDWGELTIKGENLHIENLSLETSELSIKGRIFAFIYSEEKLIKKGVFGRIFNA